MDLKRFFLIKSDNDAENGYTDKSDWTGAYDIPERQISSGSRIPLGSFLNGLQGSFVENDPKCHFDYE
jgi:hypothetical protein